MAVEGLRVFAMLRMGCRGVSGGGLGESSPATTRLSFAFSENPGKNTSRDQGENAVIGIANGQRHTVAAGVK